MASAVFHLSNSLNSVLGVGSGVGGDDGVSDHGTTHMRVGRIGPVAREEVEGPARQLDEDERGAVRHVGGLDVRLLHAVHLRGRTSQREVVDSSLYGLTSWARCGQRMGEGEGGY